LCRGWFAKVRAITMMTQRICAFFVSLSSSPSPIIGSGLRRAKKNFGSGTATKLGKENENPTLDVVRKYGKNKEKRKEPEFVKKGNEQPQNDNTNAVHPPESLLQIKKGKNGASTSMEDRDLEDERFETEYKRFGTMQQRSIDKVRNTIKKFRSSKYCTGHFFPDDLDFSKKEIAFVAISYALLRMVSISVGFVEHLAVPVLVAMSSSPYFTGDSPGGYGVKTMFQSTISLVFLSLLFYVILDGFLVWSFRFSYGGRSSANRKTNGNLKTMYYFKWPSLTFLEDASSIVMTYLQFYLLRGTVFSGVSSDSAGGTGAGSTGTGAAGSNNNPQNILSDASRIASLAVIIQCIDLGVILWGWCKDASQFLPGQISTSQFQSEAVLPSEAGAHATTSDATSSENSSSNKSVDSKANDLKANPSRQEEKEDKAFDSKTRRQEENVFHNRPLRMLREIADNIKAEDNTKDKFASEKKGSNGLNTPWSHHERRQIYEGAVGKFFRLEYSYKLMQWFSFLLKDLLIPLGDFASQYFLLSEMNSSTKSHLQTLVFNTSLILLLSYNVLHAYTFRAIEIYYVDIQVMLSKLFENKDIPVINKFYPLGWVAGMHWLAFLIGMVCYHPGTMKLLPKEFKKSVIQGESSSETANLQLLAIFAIITTLSRVFAKVFRDWVMFERWKEERRKTGKVLLPEQPWIVVKAASEKADTDRNGNPKAETDRNGNPKMLTLLPPGTGNKKPIYVHLGSYKFLPEEKKDFQETPSTDFPSSSRSATVPETTSNPLARMTTHQFMEKHKHLNSQDLNKDSKVKDLKLCSGDIRLCFEDSPNKARSLALCTLHCFKKESGTLDPVKRIWDLSLLPLDPDSNADSKSDSKSDSNSADIFEFDSGTKFSNSECLLWNPWETLRKELVECSRESHAYVGPVSFSEIMLTPLLKTGFLRSGNRFLSMTGLLSLKQFRKVKHREDDAKTAPLIAPTPEEDPAVVMEGDPNIMESNIMEFSPVKFVLKKRQ